MLIAKPWPISNARERISRCPPLLMLDAYRTLTADSFVETHFYARPETMFCSECDGVTRPVSNLKIQVQQERVCQSHMRCPPLVSPCLPVPSSLTMCTRACLRQLRVSRHGAASRTGLHREDRIPAFGFRAERLVTALQPPANHHDCWFSPVLQPLAASFGCRSNTNAVGGVPHTVLCMLLLHAQR